MIIKYRFLGVYGLVSILLGVIFQQPNWLTILFLLNGSVLITGIFILPDIVVLDRHLMFKYAYIIICGIFSALLSYFIHFIFAPYLVVMLVQLVTLGFDFIKKEDIPLLAKHASKEANPLYPVPKLLSAKELEKIYYQIQA